MHSDVLTFATGYQRDAITRGSTSRFGVWGSQGTRTTPKFGSTVNINFCHGTAPA